MALSTSNVLEMVGSRDRIVSFFSSPCPVIGRSVAALLQPSMIAVSGFCSLDKANLQQIAGLCLEFHYDVAEWAVLAMDRELMLNYFLGKANSQIDDPRAERWCVGDRVAVSEHGVEAIEGSQLLLPPSVVSFIARQMEQQDRLDQFLVDAVIAETATQEPIIGQVEPTPKAKTSSKRKKTAPSKGSGIEKFLPRKQAGAAEQPVEAIPQPEAPETMEFPDIAALRIPKKRRDDSSQVNFHTHTLTCIFISLMSGIAVCFP